MTRYTVLNVNIAGMSHTLVLGCCWFYHGICMSYHYGLLLWYPLNGSLYTGARTTLTRYTKRLYIPRTPRTLMHSIATWSKYCVRNGNVHLFNKKKTSVVINFCQQHSFNPVCLYARTCTFSLNRVYFCRVIQQYKYLMSIMCIFSGIYA